MLSLGLQKGYVSCGGTHARGIVDARLLAWTSAPDTADKQHAMVATIKVARIVVLVIILV